MRVALLSLDFPPASTEGIPRQRATLAGALAAKGVEVHVITLGRYTKTYRQSGYTVHSVASPSDTIYVPSSAGLNRRLTQSQLLYEATGSIEQAYGRLDLIDSPLWGLQSYVVAHYAQAPVILWLQTTQAQMYQIHGRRPERWERIELDLERFCLSRASAWLADSDSILGEVEKSYHVTRPARAKTVHLGLTDSLRTPQVASDHVRALAVGRLEKRKGTQLLFRALPSLLAEYPNLKVRFIGADNSAADGWFAQHGCTYADFWHRAWPALADRVDFSGSVDDKELPGAYAEADFVLAPSLYESFGLVYLEAMRASLPVVALKTGAAIELFPRGEADGALLVDEPVERTLTAAISELIRDVERRSRIGNAGRQRFETHFTADRMASDSLRFYEQVAECQPLERGVASRPVFQVMEALDVGDAVSSITRTNAQILGELGQPTRILALHHHRALRDEVQDPAILFREPKSNAIFHYWGYSQLAWMLKYIKGSKALYYHNITPSTYFDPSSPAHESTQSGYKQLARIANDFDLLIGDSVFNLLELAPYLRQPKPALCIYPVIEADLIQQQPVDEALHHQLTSEHSTNFLMVGRIARNKRQDRVMRVFDHYWRYINRRAHLWLVGSETSDPGYKSQLAELHASLASRDHIHFTGKVPEPAIAAYYRAADVFVCASKHEGFCMPLIEAMAYRIPVIAWAATAIPETMGIGGILINTWDAPRVAELIHVVLKDQMLRQTILSKQTLNLRRFTKDEARKRLRVALEFMNHAMTSHPFVFTIEPGAN